MRYFIPLSPDQAFYMAEYFMRRLREILPPLQLSTHRRHELGKKFLAENRLTMRVGCLFSISKNLSLYFAGVRALLDKR